MYLHSPRPSQVAVEVATLSHHRQACATHEPRSLHHLAVVRSASAIEATNHRSLAGAAIFPAPNPPLFVRSNQIPNLGVENDGNSMSEGCGNEKLGIAIITEEVVVICVVLVMVGLDAEGIKRRRFLFSCCFVFPL